MSRTPLGHRPVHLILPLHLQRRPLLLAGLLSAVAPPALAQNQRASESGPSSQSGPSSAGGPSALSLAGRMGDKALVVAGNKSLVLAVGQSERGVKLLRWEQGVAVVDQSGQVLRLAPGAAPARVLDAGQATAASGTEIVIPAGDGGHFLAPGTINGQAVRFMVDTGATLIAVPKPDAERLGIDVKQGRPVSLNTAGGQALGWTVTLAAVRVGEVQVHNVQAVVTANPMPYVLLGNSFLSRFQMKRENDVMRLTLR